MNVHESLLRAEADMEILAARAASLHDHLLVFTDDAAAVTLRIAESIAAVNALRAAHAVAVSGTGPVDDTRKVWVAAVPDGDEYGVGPVEVMIEQFGDRPPTVAFRRGGNPSVWARPYRSEAR